jgi:GAF domain-containing protein
MPTSEPSPDSLPRALDILRECAGGIDRLPADAAPAGVLWLIAPAAVRLVDSQKGDEPTAVIYCYDAERGAFDPAPRISAGEGAWAAPDDYPRPEGMGAWAVRHRRRILSYEEPCPPAPLIKPAAAKLSLPILVKEQPVAVLFVSLKNDRRFSEGELLALDLLAGLAAMSIRHLRHSAELSRALQRKAEEVERLHVAEELISSRRSLAETLREILRTAVELSHAAHGSFRLIDKRTGRLRLAALSGEADLPVHPVEPDLPADDTHSVVGWVAKHRRPVRIDDLRREPWNAIYRPLHSKGRMLSELATPLLGAGGALEGVINLENPRINAFREEDQNLMEALATQAVIALQEARLLEALEEVTVRMTQWPLDRLLAFIIQQACDLINAPHGVVWVLAPEDPQMLVVRAATAGHTPGETLPLTGSLIGTSLRERRPLTSSDVSQDPRFLRRDLARKMGWVSGMIVPLLMRDGTPRGALTLYSSEPRSFSEWDQRLLSWLANHTAIAIQDAETLDQLAQARERQTLAETFAALGDVAANLLHRVNNLVGIIPVRVQGVIDKRPALAEDAYVAGALQEVEDNARTAMAAAREAMAYLRPMKLQPTSIDVCFRTALDRAELPENIRVAAAGLESLPPVLAGAGQLRLVFFNLLENAADALAGLPAGAGREPVIRIEGRRRGGSPQVEIQFADNGPGVPPDRRENIFDLAFSTKRSPRKLGFGLWWVKTLINRLGGEIRLAETPEPGCTFLITLPTKEQKDPSPPSDPAGNAPGGTA